jgi:hypothetical protein
MDGAAGVRAMDGVEAVRPEGWWAQQGEPGFRAACGAPANDRPWMAGLDGGPWTASKR